VGYENGGIASFGRAVAPNCLDLPQRQIAFFLTLPGYERGSIIAEAQGPTVNREPGSPAVFIFDNDCHAVAGHRFTARLGNGEPTGESVISKFGRGLLFR
jgi:hypothetical protein